MTQIIRRLLATNSDMKAAFELQDIDGVIEFPKDRESILEKNYTEQIFLERTTAGVIEIERGSEAFKGISGYEPHDLQLHQHVVALYDKKMYPAVISRLPLSRKLDGNVDEEHLNSKQKGGGRHPEMYEVTFLDGNRRIKVDILRRDVFENEEYAMNMKLDGKGMKERISSKLLEGCIQIDIRVRDSGVEDIISAWDESRDIFFSIKEKTFRANATSVVPSAPKQEELAGKSYDSVKKEWKKRGKMKCFCTFA